jgi:hypothetical protein
LRARRKEKEIRAALALMAASSPALFSVIEPHPLPSSVALIKET